MEIQKHRVSFNEENYRMAESVYKIYNFSSVSELIDTAVAEWLAQRAGQMVSHYMSKELTSIIENTMQLSERRINRMLFKLAVSDAELKHVLATEYSIDEKFLERIHERSEREVRLTNGMLNLNQVIEGQNGVDEL